ncbi:MAG: 23S rRNA pseudouridine(1911/1915/1917) synthase RluD [Proteobacteria bacterium]|nr:23S rRNA pseudouridine(1911/1915/1917) synthase RluD [Pseudomonadota bacterium]
MPFDLAGRRLDQALAQQLPQYSRSRLQQWITLGAVLVDGKAPRSRDVVLGGESVRVEARLEADTTVLPQTMPLNVVYEDESILIIDKPAGRVVHPGAGNRDATLQNALLAYDQRLALLPRAGLVHRIDKDTSGLLVVARNLISHTALVARMAEHAVERDYLAVCVGRMTAGGTVDAPIGRHRTQRTKMTVRTDGRAAVTHYRVQERFRGHTYLRVQLETGRTHQIRVHMAHVGYPLVGDPLYGGRPKLPPKATPELLATLAVFKRQALHAAQLRLAHPETGEPLEFSSPLPADFVHLLDVLRADVVANAA